MGQRLGDSWDVVEVVRGLAGDVQALQDVVAALEARLQVLEREAKAEAKPKVKPGGGA